jgi:hypothetical protein
MYTNIKYCKAKYLWLMRYLLNRSLPVPCFSHVSATWCILPVPHHGILRVCIPHVFTKIMEVLLRISIIPPCNNEPEPQGSWHAVGGNSMTWSSLLPKYCCLIWKWKLAQIHFYSDSVFQYPVTSVPSRILQFNLWHLFKQVVSN